jgi:hypothetical protein
MTFNEPQFIKLIFLLSDTKTWLEELEKSTFSQLPLTEKKKLFKQNYYLTASALAHIIELHYYKINRHPEAGKFHIELIEILHYIREAKTITPTPVPGCSNMQRIIQTNQPIGFDQNGQPASAITIITDNAGNIITAFPGTINNIQHQCREENTIVFPSRHNVC